MKITINKPTDFEAKFLKVDAGVRYWDDAKVNGEYDTNCEDSENPAAAPTIPCAEYVGEQNRVLHGENYRWRPLIDIETGQITNWRQGTTANIHYKVCDDFKCDILDADMNVIASYNDYVPTVMCPKEEGYGDYIIMDIDENGFIQAWRKKYIVNLIKNKED